VRILWYGKWFPVDGNYVYTRQITHRQADMGHSVAVVYHGRDDLNARSRDKRIEYYALPSVHPGPAWAVESLATRRAMEGVIRNFRPDVIHSSLQVGTFDRHLPSLCADFDVPLVVTFHVSFARVFSRSTARSAATYSLYRNILSSAAAVVALGPHQKAWLRRFGGVRESRVQEIPHGVNHVRFCPGVSEWREQFKESFLVGYIGRLASEKNLEALCNGYLRASLKDARLLLVGQGEAARRLQRSWGSNESISFIDHINDRGVVADAMRGLDVFVLPSRIEGLSLSLLEAMASGVVPVATDVGEHHSLVDGCGVLVNPARATEGITRALVELSLHPERRRTLAVASRNRARRRGWDRTANDLMSLYRRL
jgi:glycosyltransferase involved in cell wall biosynthesis